MYRPSDQHRFPHKLALSNGGFILVVYDTEILNFAMVRGINISGIGLKPPPAKISIRLVTVNFFPTGAILKLPVLDYAIRLPGINISLFAMAIKSCGIGRRNRMGKPNALN